MNQNEFLNRPNQKVTIRKMSGDVKTDFMAKVTSAPTAQLPGDAKSGYNGVDSAPVTSYQPGGNQVQKMPFKPISNTKGM